MSKREKGKIKSYALESENHATTDRCKNYGSGGDLDPHVPGVMMVDSVLISSDVVKSGIWSVDGLG
jgi:hypothetical protein